MAKQNFMADLKSEMINDPNMQYNVSVTENGAYGYKSTGSIFVDTLFQIPSLRNADPGKLVRIWHDLYDADPKLAVLFLFYIGDIRKGMGERNTFRTMLKVWAMDNPDEVKDFVQFIPEYSRWDIMIDLIGLNLDLNSVIGGIIERQLCQDIAHATKGEPVSLLGKWMPSYNTSSERTKSKARSIAKLLGYNLQNPSDQRMYRKTLTILRKAIKVVEADMSTSNWDKIDYSAVPSKANLKYKDAFAKHDPERFNKYIQDVAAGNDKINASVAFPSDIVYKYSKESNWNHSSLINYNEEDPVLEALWKALPSYETTDDSDVLCVVDTSGSMYTYVGGGSNMTARDVAYSLGIYFAEHDKGAFRNSFITFSSTPSIVKFKEGDSLLNKLCTIVRNTIISHTNIEAVFDLILDTAVYNKYTQEDIPGSILIISDMEFDFAQGYQDCADKRLFNTIAKKYEAMGYKLPKLIFWNVNSRSNTIPIRTNENGVLLVSGYSVNTMKMVLSKELDPEKALLKILFDERYQPIIDILFKEKK